MFRETRKCAHCGDKFVARHPSALCCSKSCRVLKSIQKKKDLNQSQLEGTTSMPEIPNQLQLTGEKPTDINLSSVINYPSVSLSDFTDLDTGLEDLFDELK